MGNYNMEPPGLFRGRGEHPRTGALKKVRASKSQPTTLMKHSLPCVVLCYAVLGCVVFYLSLLL
jgi:hypothetical protein